MFLFLSYFLFAVRNNVYFSFVIIIIIVITKGMGIPGLNTFIPYTPSCTLALHPKTHSLIHARTHARTHARIRTQVDMPYVETCSVVVYLLYCTKNTELRVIKLVVDIII